MRKRDENVTIEFNMEEYQKMKEKYWYPGSKNCIQDEILADLVEKYPSNTSIKDVYAKVTMLNALYSTQIYNTYDVAKEICNVNIEEQLRNGNIEAVNLIRSYTFSDKSGKDKVFNFYSFATKYCNLHNREAFPIYDSYVEDVLIYLRNARKIKHFKNEDLKNPEAYKKILEDIISDQNSAFAGLSLKEIDQYLWAVGKENYHHYY